MLGDGATVFQISINADFRGVHLLRIFRKPHFFLREDTLKFHQTNFWTLRIRFCSRFRGVTLNPLPPYVWRLKTISSAVDYNLKKIVWGKMSSRKTSFIPSSLPSLTIKIFKKRVRITAFTEILTGRLKVKIRRVTMSHLHNITSRTKSIRFDRTLVPWHMANQRYESIWTRHGRGPVPWNFTTINISFFYTW